MIPFQKIFTVLIRAFSKPVLNYLKQRQAQNKMAALRWLFVRVGRRYQIMEHWMNHKILKTTHKKQMTQLKQQILMEKGIQALYQLFFYSIVIGFPMYQLYTSAVSAEKKEKKLQQNIVDMQGDLKSINFNLEKVVSAVKRKNDQFQKLNNQRNNRLAQISKEKEQRRLKQFKQYLLRKEQQQHQRLNKIMAQETALRQSQSQVKTSQSLTQNNPSTSQSTPNDIN